MDEKGVGALRALDVHKEQVTACVRIPARAASARSCREFSTMTADLLALRDWLKELGVTHVAMEATGVYWKPVYYVLEDDFELLLVNAQHVKNVPAARPTSRTPSGCASCWSAGSCARASCRRSRSESCAT